MKKQNAVSLEGVHAHTHTGNLINENKLYNRKDSDTIFVSTLDTG